MKQNTIYPEHNLTMSVLVIIFSATLLAFAGTTTAQGTLYFCLPHVHFYKNYKIPIVFS